MTVSTYGSSTTGKTRIGDNATPGSGSYELYFRFKSRKCNIRLPQIDGTNQATEAGNNLGATLGKILGVYTFQGHLHPVNNTEYLKLLKALHAWSDANTLCYLTVSDNAGSNQAQYYAFESYSSAVQWRGRIAEITIEDNEDGSTQTINLIFTRYTA